MKSLIIGIIILIIGFAWFIWLDHKSEKSLLRFRSDLRFNQRVKIYPDEFPEQGRVLHYAGDVTLVQNDEGDVYNTLTSNIYPI